MHSIITQLSLILISSFISIYILFDFFNKIFFRIENSICYKFFRNLEHFFLYKYIQHRNIKFTFFPNSTFTNSEISL